MFPDAVCERLSLVGIAARDIADEGMRMSELAFGPTRNRSLLGTLNDFVFMAQRGTLDGPNPSHQRSSCGSVADPNSSAGRREPDRVIANRIWGVNRCRDGHRLASLRCSIVRNRLGASRLPSGAARS